LTPAVQLIKLPVEMGSSFANLKWRLLLAIAVAAGVSPAGAQGLARSGQPLLLSAPEGDAVLTNTPSLAPKAPNLPDFSDTINASGFNFKAPVDATPLPAPAASAMSAAEAVRLQALRDKSSNWTMQTPEEIMNVPTPEKIFGITESDTGGLAPKKTAAERYLDRQQQSRNARTNTYAADVFQPGPDFSNNQNPQWNPNALFSPGASPNTPAAMNPFMGNPALNNSSPNSFSSAGLFRSPALPTSAPTSDQQAAMDQFSKLLEPRSPPPSAVRTAASDNNFPAPRKTPDSLLKSPVVLIGMPASPAVTGIGAPVGVAALPGILGQTNAVSATAPSWKPELPPWMSSAPRLGEIPQRKF
jgi:hypothetical protein